MRWTFLVVIVASMAAASCGGTDTVPFGDTSGSGGSSTSTSASAATSTAGAGAMGQAASTGAGMAGGSATGGGGGAPEVCEPAMGDCKTQILDLLMKLAEAKTCNPNQDNQCTQTIQGPCCTEAVNDASSPAAKCFLETLSATQCDVGCGGEPCAPVEGICSSEGEGPPHCI